MTTFKAWTYSKPGYPSALELTEITLHPHPKSNEIHIRVQAAALNQIDIQLMNVPVWKVPGLRHQKGIGEDFAGEVVAVGSNVTQWKLGDQVWGFTMHPFGTVAEMMSLDTTKAVILPRPERLSATDAASIPMVFLTAYTALVSYAGFPNPPNTSPSILVLGGSTAVGIYTLQIASKRLNCHVVATASTRNIEFVKSLGAIDVIDYTKTSILKGALQHLPDGGYDAIIDFVGGTELIPHLNTLLKPKAAYVTTVGDRTSRHLLGGAIIYPLFPKMVVRSLMGYLGYGRKYYCMNLDPKEEYLKVAIEMLASGDLKTIVDSVHSLEDGLKAFERLSEGKANGKIVISCQ